MAALCSSYIYLVRVAGIYMIVLCCLCGSTPYGKYDFVISINFLLYLTDFLAVVAYIIYISFTSVNLIFGTSPESSDLQFACYFLQKEDIDNMPRYARGNMRGFIWIKLTHGKRKTVNDA